jgi:hypothetical protein
MKTQPIAITSHQPMPQTQQPNVDLPEADPTAETPDEHADSLEQAKEDDYIIPSPLTPLGSLPHPQQLPPRPQQPLP